MSNISSTNEQRPEKTQENAQTLQQPGTRRELYAGLTTFLTMSYIILTNPAILSTTGMPFTALVTTTVLVSALGSILMGLLARLPVAIAPGMGLNAFFAFSLVGSGMVSWQSALGIVFVSGVVFILISATPIRHIISSALPEELRYGISGGIGLFIAFIGLQWSGFIAPHPATLVQFGGINAKTVVFIIGLIVIVFLTVRRVNGAAVYGIVFTTLLAALASIVLPSLKDAPLVAKPEAFFALPDFSLIGALRFDQVFTWGAIIPIFSFLFVTFFDTFSTLFGLAEAGGFIDPKTRMPKNAKRAFLADSISAAASGLLGSSPGTAYIESASGIREGGKTGLTAITAGVLFIPFMFLSPLLSAIPQLAIAPVLVLVGISMMTPLAKTDWRSPEIALPTFLALILMPLTFSLSIGISWGILSYVGIKILLGKFKEIPPALWAISVIVAIALAQMF